MTTYGLGYLTPRYTAARVIAGAQVIWGEWGTKGKRPKYPTTYSQAVTVAVKLGYTWDATCGGWVRAS
jgi:hypothetical protein